MNSSFSAPGFTDAELTDIRRELDQLAEDAAAAILKAAHAIDADTRVYASFENDVFVVTLWFDPQRRETYDVYVLNAERFASERRHRLHRLAVRHANEVIESRAMKAAVSVVIL